MSAACNVVGKNKRVNAVLTEMELAEVGSLLPRSFPNGSRININLAPVQDLDVKLLQGCLNGLVAVRSAALPVFNNHLDDIGYIFVSEPFEERLHISSAGSHVGILVLPSWVDNRIQLDVTELDCQQNLVKNKPVVARLEIIKVNLLSAG